VECVRGHRGGAIGRRNTKGLEIEKRVSGGRIQEKNRKKENWQNHDPEINNQVLEDDRLRRKIHFEERIPRIKELKNGPVNGLKKKRRTFESVNYSQSQAKLLIPKRRERSTRRATNTLYKKGQHPDRKCGKQPSTQLESKDGSGPRGYY